MKQIVTILRKLSLALPQLSVLFFLCSCGARITTQHSKVEAADYPTGLVARVENVRAGDPVCNYHERMTLTPHIRFDANTNYTTMLFFVDTKPELGKPYSLDDYGTSGGPVRMLTTYDGSLEAKSFVVTFRQADDTAGSAIVMDYVLETVSGLHAEGTLETALKPTDYLGCASPL